MKVRVNDIDERAKRVGRYIIENKATIRGTAKCLKMSKSTVYKDFVRLKVINPKLYNEVENVVLHNKAARNIRGGEATRRKYEVLRC